MSDSKNVITDYNGNPAICTRFPLFRATVKVDKDLYPEDFSEHLTRAYKTPGSAGFDIKASEDFVIPADGSVILVPTGLRMEIPECLELQIRPRSGLALKGVIIPNSPGTIDSDYRDEIKVMMSTTSGKDISFSRGDRIAQGVFSVYVQAVFELVSGETLSETDRHGGFGSTGVK